MRKLLLVMLAFMTIASAVSAVLCFTWEAKYRDTPLSTTVVSDPSIPKFEAGLCPGGDGTNIVIKQSFTSYVIEHGFTSETVCNGRLDTITYETDTSELVPLFRIMVGLTAISLAGLIVCLVRRPQETLKTQNLYHR